MLIRRIIGLPLGASALLASLVMGVPAQASAATSDAAVTSTAASNSGWAPRTTPGGSAKVIAPYALRTRSAVVTSIGSHKRLVVGDSLMVGGARMIGSQGFAVHAKVGRQFWTAPEILSSYGSALPSNVIIELGTNGTISLATCRNVVRIAGPERRVFFVNNRVPRSWEASNNRTLRTCDQSFSTTRVRVIDWYTTSAGHSSWFGADGVHLTSEGMRIFVGMIDRQVDRRGLN